MPALAVHVARAGKEATHRRGIRVGAEQGAESRGANAALLVAKVAGGHGELQAA